MVELTASDSTRVVSSKVRIPNYAQFSCNTFLHNKQWVRILNRYTKTVGKSPDAAPIDHFRVPAVIPIIYTLEERGLLRNRFRTIITISDSRKS